MTLFSLKLIKFLIMHEFDGVLLDYEFPGMLSRGSYLHSKHGFSLLIQVTFN
jgi:GH18 family chitinase